MTIFSDHVFSLTTFYKKNISGLRFTN